MEIITYIGLFLIGFAIGIITFYSLSKKRDLSIKEWIKLLEEREELLNQRDTERYQVNRNYFHDT